MAVYIGDFLLEKMQNMIVWLRDGGYEGPLMTHLLSPLTATAISQELAQRAQVLIDEDWSVVPELPGDLQAVAAWVKQTPHMHEKFWRYLRLFSDTVSKKHE